MILLGLKLILFCILHVSHFVLLVVSRLQHATSNAKTLTSIELWHASVAKAACVLREGRRAFRHVRSRRKTKAKGRHSTIGTHVVTALYLFAMCIGCEFSGVYWNAFVVVKDLYLELSLSVGEKKKFLYKWDPRGQGAFCCRL